MLMIRVTYADLHKQLSSSKDPRCLKLRLSTLFKLQAQTYLSPLDSIEVESRIVGNSKQCSKAVMLPGGQEPQIQKRISRMQEWSVQSLEVLFNPKAPSDS